MRVGPLSRTALTPDSRDDERIVFIHDRNVAALGSRHHHFNQHFLSFEDHIEWRCERKWRHPSGERWNRASHRFQLGERARDFLEGRFGLGCLGLRSGNVRSGNRPIDDACLITHALDELWMHLRHPLPRSSGAPRSIAPQPPWDSLCKARSESRILCLEGARVHSKSNPKGKAQAVPAQDSKTHALTTNCAGRVRAGGPHECMIDASRSTVDLSFGVNEKQLSTNACLSRHRSPDHREGGDSARDVLHLPRERHLHPVGTEPERARGYDLPLKPPPLFRGGHAASRWGSPRRTHKGFVRSFEIHRPARGFSQARPISVRHRVGAALAPPDAGPSARIFCASNPGPPRSPGRTLCVAARDYECDTSRNSGVSACETEQVPEQACTSECGSADFGYSRASFVRLTEQEDFPLRWECLAAAFDYFGMVSSKKRLDGIHDVVLIIYDWNPPPFVKRRTRVRNAEAHHIADEQRSII